ncbi:putative nucleic-acid-binding protein containing a Zn-ribbon [Archaeoglobus sulfaticallidus PM70-1]|uniref:Putative nucleic-acid-binding protein containing a Zn-ribbon n=1 Tax=Archaeoglobus sulfaticallidus PM70-1 TaxID=387631 RepID=N0BC40_9EURY|nr:Zn-ribbon domain-containing OB-fold protein [Archaeoglobus sulfaticallidus]AGK61189.1 putative nucleic-acid-binding protein containing a Zn-ribbon [Archaeoglobus sulfaticallidus PM70-1]
MYIKSRNLLLGHKIAVNKTEKYWKGLEYGKIYKTVCECGREYYPPQAECSFCRKETEWVEIDGYGVVETFTVVQSVPSGFEWIKAYTIAIARFGNVRVMGWGNESVKVGDRVRAYTQKDESGVWKVYFEVV